MKKLFAKLAALRPIVNETCDGVILVVTWRTLGFVRVIDPTGHAHFRLGVFSLKEASELHASTAADWCSNTTSKNLLLVWEQIASEISDLKATRKVTAEGLAKCKQVILNVIEVELAYRTFHEKRELAGRGIFAA